MTKLLSFFERIKSRFFSKFSLLLNRMPRFIRSRIPSRTWVYLAKLVEDRYQKSVKSAYGPFVVQSWSDSTFRQGVLGRYGFVLSDLIRSRSYPFTFVDVGANMGIYSLIAANAPNCKRVFAIEPNPIVVERLHENIQINNAQVEIHECGIGERNGSITLNYKANHTGRGNLIGQGGEEIEVEIRNRELFNSIADRVGNLPVLVKIDVEGYEAVVMRELVSSKISDQVDGVFVEVTEKWAGEAGVEQIFDIAKKLGLDLHKKHGQGWQYDVYFCRSSL